MALIGIDHRSALSRMVRQRQFPEPAKTATIKNVEYNFWTRNQLLAWLWERAKAPEHITDAIRLIEAQQEAERIARGEASTEHTTLLTRMSA